MIKPRIREEANLKILQDETPDGDVRLVKILDGTPGSVSPAGVSDNPLKIIQLPYIGKDAGDRQRVSQLTTLGDYKTLNADRALLVENAGTGTGAFTNNKFNMSVVAGEWFVRQSRRFHPYFSGKSQLVELTFDGFGLQANVVKRAGYFSSSAVSPFDTTYDGFWLENTGTSFALRADRAGAPIINVDWRNWDNYEKVKNYEWNNFTVILFDFLWLGGTFLRLWLVTDDGFVLCHTFHFAGNFQDTFILSPNQPIRYEIRSTTGVGSFRDICNQVSTEGSINESGLSRSVNTGSTAIAMATIGTTYPLKAIRKLATQRDIAVFVEELQVFVGSANDLMLWSLQINPTLSAPLTFVAVANSAVEQASGNGTITVTGAGTVIHSGYISTDVQIQNDLLKFNFLSFLGSTLANVMDQYVLCVTPITANVNTYGTISFKEI